MRLIGLLTVIAALSACSHGAFPGEGVVDGSGRTAAASLPLDVEAPSAAGDYLAGRFALDQGDVRTAARSFERALVAAPDNVELRRQVFLLKVAGGDVDGALRDGGQLASADPDADEVDLVLALREVRAGDYPAARQLLGELAPHGVTGLAAPLLVAWAYFGQGDLDQALTRLADTPENEGVAALRHYHQALMLGLSGRTSEALQRLEGEVKPDLPASPRIVQTVAALHAKQGSRDAALALLRAQAKLAGNEGVLTELLAQAEHGVALELPVSDAPTGMADALLGLAEALSQQRATPQALLFARLASYLAPEHGDVALLIGRIEQSQGNEVEAIRAYQAVPAGSVYAGEARLAEAGALADAGRDADAVATLEQLAKDRPDRTDALRELGDLQRRAEHYAEAEAAYAGAIARLGAPGPDDWRLYYAHGIALERLKRWPEAEASLTRALELSPDQPLVLNYLGYSWVDQGMNLDKAKAMLHRAVELRPQDGFVVDSLGWAYFRLGDYDQAVLYLERAVELEPGDPVINDHLGDSYWRVGREREARFQWARALTLKPEAGVAAEIEGKLRNGLPAVASAKRG